jgi:hypothetical protein
MKTIEDLHEFQAKVDEIVPDELVCLYAFVGI